MTDRRHMKTGNCREPDCPNKALKGVYFCSEHLDKPRRCKMRRANGQRCKAHAVTGLEVCERHGGRLKSGRLVSERTAVLTAMQRFVRPFEGDVDPIAVFEAEFRRTLGRIAWYDDQLAKLASERDLIWGQTEAKVVGSSEYPGIDRTYAARVHMFEELQRWERKHLLELEKVWIGAKLDEAKLQIMRGQVERVYTAITKALEKLGLDPMDEHVREVLAEALTEPDGAILALAETERR